jgi:large subunit ribosomal protein L21
MYAVIDLGGKQYRVRKGEYLTVDRLHHDAGSTFSPQVVFAADGDTAILDPKELAKVKVTARIDEHLLGPKVRVFTYSPKKSSKKMRGHRSRLSKITIEDIAVQKRAARAKKAAEPAEETA